MLHDMLKNEIRAFLRHMAEADFEVETVQMEKVKGMGVPTVQGGSVVMKGRDYSIYSTSRSEGPEERPALRNTVASALEEPQQQVPDLSTARPQTPPMGDHRATASEAWSEKRILESLLRIEGLLEHLTEAVEALKH